MDINKYEVFDWIKEKDLGLLSKKEANKKFEEFIKSKNKRIDELRKIIEPNLFQVHLIEFLDGGVSTLGENIKLNKPKKMTLDYSLESIQAISDWLTKYTKEYAKTIKIPPRNEQKLFKDVSSFWKSLASDISIYYFEVLKKNFDSTLTWEIQNEKVMDYNFPAITGWKKEKNYKDGILFYILREIFILITDEEDSKEDFLLYRLNYHMEELL